MPRNRRIGGEPVKSSPTHGTLADLSDVQELRVRLIREGFYGAPEERQLQALSRVVVTGHTVLCQTCLPYRDPGEARIWERRQVAVFLAL